MVNGHVHLECKCVPKIVNCFERRKGGVGQAGGEKNEV